MGLAIELAAGACPWRSTPKKMEGTLWWSTASCTSPIPRTTWSRRLGVAGGFRSFDVAPGGSRVVGVFESAESNAETALRVLLNVADELRRRLAH